MSNALLEYDVDFADDAFFVNGKEVYRPYAKQLEFHSDPHIYRLFGGAKGPGKSFALLWEAIMCCVRYPGCNALLLRRKFTDLNKSLLDHFIKYVPPFVYGGAKNYNKTEHTVSFPNGSKLFFGHCNNPDDVRDYQGGEYLFIGIDELTEFTYDMWEFLTAQNRSPLCSPDSPFYVEGAAAYMAAATNPGGRGHGWVRNVFVEKKPAPGKEDSTYNADDYSFIAANIEDNPTYANDKVYIAKLAKLSPALRAAYLKGDWNVLSGQYFDIFLYDNNVYEHSFIQKIVKPWWPKWVAIDWGFAHHTSVLWFTRGQIKIMNDETQQVENKTITITYREMLVNKTSEKAIAEEIIAATKADGEGWQNIGHVFLSHDAFNTRRFADPIAKMVGDTLTQAKLPRPTKIGAGPNSRVPGWRGMYSALEQQEWYISDSCEKLIEAIPQLMRSEDKPEDVVKTSEWYDDMGDCASYGLRMMPREKQKPLEDQLAERYAEMKEAGEKQGSSQSAINTAMYMEKLKIEDKNKKPWGAVSRKRFNRRGPN